MHSSILLLLPESNCSDPAYSHRRRRACGAEWVSSEVGWRAA